MYLTNSKARVDARLLAETNDKKDVAELQLQVRDSLQKAGVLDLDQQLRDFLEHRLLSISDLFNKCAKRYNLHEECLSIMHTAQHTDIDECQRLWQNILSEGGMGAGSTWHWAGLQGKFKRWASLYYPNYALFPLGNILKLLFQHERCERGCESVWFVCGTERGEGAWAARELIDAGVPLPEVMTAYFTSVFDQRPPSDIHSTLLCIELLSLWLQFQGSLTDCPLTLFLPTMQQQHILQHQIVNVDPMITLAVQRSQNRLVSMSVAPSAPGTPSRATTPRQQLVFGAPWP
eukprot:c12952_g1_i2.p1 GENE.c12952_g1_i2~~c12952_g1_i2.p1  ORF type:complete len:290 (-),score=79.90 c12952_g1_i2:310-1179(-)